MHGSAKGFPQRFGSQDYETTEKKLETSNMPCTYFSFFILFFQYFLFILLLCYKRILLLTHFITNSKNLDYA